MPSDRIPEHINIKKNTMVPEGETVPLEKIPKSKIETLPPEEMREAILLQGGPLAGRRKVVEEGLMEVTFPDAPSTVYVRTPAKSEGVEYIFVSQDLTF